MSKLSSSHRNINKNNSVSRSSAILAAIIITSIIIILNVIIDPLYFSDHPHQFSPDLDTITTKDNKLRRSVTFLPLKDLRYSNTALSGHTWFMSSLEDNREAKGEVQHQHFPSVASDGRVLCLKGRDTHDGAWNSYALAWPDTLPENATLMRGLTFVSYNHYDYDNIWHGLSAIVPFVAWHRARGCKAVPDRWVLYHWGELRARMGPWLATLMEATFDRRTPVVETFESIGGDATSVYKDGGPGVCFEEAVVARHNEGGMSRERLMAVYDLMRCKARAFCQVPGRDRNVPAEIGMTVFMRTGPRSFRDGPAVLSIFRQVCATVKGCRFRVAYSSNLTFCDQVRLMSLTDVLISPHGAQLTNMFLMDRNSSVMEFYPKGWLELAGVGQYVYKWIANWSGMIHRGAWRDQYGDDTCTFPDGDRRCMRIFKNNMIGHNQTYFSEWASKVLRDAKAISEAMSFDLNNSFCSC